ncbi:MAG: hypothetical protein ABSC06_33320 [Rhodopila sp.]
MTSIASPASSTTAPAGTSTLFPATARALLVLVTAASVAAGPLATGTEAAASAIALAGADLTHLLRAMALLKVAMAAGMAAAVLWRFGSPVTLAWWAAYALACAGMAAGPGLIWQMAYVRTGALLLHAGLFAALILLWRDPATAARLGTMVAARRAALRARKGVAGGPAPTKTMEPGGAGMRGWPT